MNFDFNSFFWTGVYHIFSFDSLDHLYFLISLILGVNIQNKKELLLRISLFTIGHTISMFFSSSLSSLISLKWIEILILASIAFNILVNLIFTKSNNFTQRTSSAFFGLIHGLGFASFSALLLESNGDNYIAVLSLALGVELSQVAFSAVVFLALWSLLKFGNIPFKKLNFASNFMLLGAVIQLFVIKIL